MRTAIVTLAVALGGCLAAMAQERNVSALLWWSQDDHKSGLGQLIRTSQRMARMPDAAAGTTLAAHVSQDGAWTFFNMAGETFTAANDAELKRGFETLLPDLGARRMSVLLTLDSVAERSKLVARLPKADLALGWGDETFKISTMAAGGDAAAFAAEIKPGLTIQLNDVAAFAEAMALLRRPLAREGFRVVSLTPGGPRTFTSTPRIDRTTGRAEIDEIDPAFLAAALGGLRGQTAVLTGRVGEGTLTFKPAAGPEQTVAIDGLAAAAASGDANLLVLKASSTQQPGGRNWLWQRVEVKGLETALGHATLADFFAALGGAENRMVMRIEQPTASRTTLSVRPMGDTFTVASTTAKLGSVLADAVSGLAGNVTHQGAVGNFASADRQLELERRLLPFIPSAAQWSYGVLLLLGLLGMPRSWRWWARLWPAEAATDYPSAFGFWMARAARTLFFAAAFMPAVAVAAVPMTLFSTVRRLMARREMESAV